MDKNVFVFVIVSYVWHFSILWAYNRESCYPAVDTGEQTACVGRVATFHAQ